MRRRTMVTGADGYIGAVLVGRLQAARDVVGLDTSYYGDGLLFIPPWDPPQLVQMDVRDLSADDLSGFEAVVCLSDLNDPTCEAMPDLGRSINLDANRRLAMHARDAGVRRYIFSSSASVYGHAATPADERHELSPITLYAAHKEAVEASILDLADTSFQVTCLRNATVYGASPRQRFDLVINFVAGLAALGEPIRLSSDGSALRPFVHIDDVCTTIETLLDSDVAAAVDRLNVGSVGGNLRVGDACSRVAAVGGQGIELGPEADARSYALDVGRLRGLGLDFERDLEDDVAAMIEQFQRSGIARSDLDSGPFVRLRHLERLVSTGKLDRDLRWVGE